MKKQIAGILLLGILIAFGCSRPPVVNSAPVDLNAALAQAKAQNKLVLMEFTGSDWCPPCMKLQKEIFSRSAFQAYAQSNLVFLTIDFPNEFQLPPAAGATNAFLAEKFDVQGYPTLIALNGDGKEIWRQVGSFDGGLKKLDADLAAVRPKASIQR
jgi:thioredoxin-related protein